MIEKVTDPVLLSALSKQGIDKDYVEFYQDYAMPAIVNGKKEKGKSPYAKFYRDLKSNKRFMVVSGLPMVDADGVKCEPKWVQTGNTYHTKANVFSALVNDIPGRITLTVKNDDAVGRKKNDKVVLRPQLFLNGIEVPRPDATLLPVDPVNSNYLENTLEWDYGICKRRLRQIEGRIHGSWVFPSNPGGDVRIVYNQTGDYRLKLGQYATDNDTELIPSSVFAGATYPFTVSDSATYYPDADPETTSVDGAVSHFDSNGLTWAAIRTAAGTTADDTTILLEVIKIRCDGNADKWDNLYRGIFLFDSSGLPDDATISAAVFSLHSSSKRDDGGITPDINVYASTPASNTALIASDFIDVATTPFCDTALTYGGWSTTGYNDFTLNAAGIAAISKTTITKLGCRNANYDVSGTTPAYASGELSYLTCRYAEAGTAYKPKLVVTYTVPVTHYGAATLAGIGTLAGIPHATFIGKSTLIGVGTLASIGQRITYGIATLSGTGTLVTNGVITVIGKATLSGIGMLASIGRGIFTGTATLVGIGTLTASAFTTLIGKATMAGAGTLSALGQRITYGVAALSGVGTLSALSGILLAGKAILSGMGSLCALSGLLLTGKATLLGIGSLNVLGGFLLLAKATLSGMGSLVAKGTVWFCKLIRINPSRLEIIRLKSSRLPLCREVRRS